MSKARPKERYESCSHRFACDRMANRANLLVWYSSVEEVNESVACAYMCEECKEWEEASHDDAR